MVSRITKRVVDAQKAGAKRSVVWDGEIRGFGLRMTQAGVKTYLVKYRTRTGVQRWFTIGKHGSPWTPETARQEAFRVLSEVAKGGDPEKDKQDGRKVLTVAELCDTYVAEGTSHKKASTNRSDLTRIERHIKPLLGSKRVDAVTDQDIEKFIEAVEAGKTAEAKRRKFGKLARGGAGAARQCASLLGTIFSFGVRRKMRADNPVRGVKKPKGREIERWLSSDEISRLASTLNEYEAGGGNAFAVAAIKLLLFTGARKSEIISLRWREVDIQRKVLRLPDSKTGAKVIRLNAPALAVLSELPRFESNPHVIPGTIANASLKGLDKIWRGIRSRASLADLRIHDLRHNFASVAAGRGESLLMIGKLLGHSQASTTSRYAHIAADPAREAGEAVASAIAAAMKPQRSGVLAPLHRGGRHT
jgi:integrase